LAGKTWGWSGCGILVEQDNAAGMDCQETGVRFNPASLVYTLPSWGAGVLRPYRDLIARGLSLTFGRDSASTFFARSVLPVSGQMGLRGLRASARI
jgi:hypothetical protein